MKSRFSIIIFIIGLLILTGCTQVQKPLDSTIQCDDGRIVSVSEGCNKLQYDFYLKYSVKGTWAIGGFTEIFGDGKLIKEYIYEPGDSPIKTERTLSKEEIEMLIELIKERFFDIPNETLNYNDCLDGAETTLYVKINGNEKTVKEYCSNNGDYSNIIKMINELTPSEAIR